MKPRALFLTCIKHCRSAHDHAIWLVLIGAILFVVPAANATDLVWIGGTGNWDSAANWSPAQVPGPADNVFITNPGTYTVILNKPDVDPAVVGSLTLGGASGTQTLSVGNVVLTLNGASVVNANGQLDLTLNSSELNGPGSVTVDGTLNWAGGTIGGPGETTIGSGGVMTISGGVTLLTRTLNIEGTANWSAGTLDIDTGSVVNNLAGGTFNIGFDGSASSGGAGGGVFNNAGLLQKTDGTLTANVGLQFNNTGSVDVRSGTLSLDDGGVHTGTFSTVSGAAAEFGGGNHVLSSASLFTGVLSLRGGATLAASGTFDAGTTFNVISGTATLASSCNVTTTTVNISGTGGSVIYNSSGAVGTVNVSAGTLAGTSPVNVTGLLTLAGGDISNPLVTANGGLNISGNVTLIGGKLINPGTAIWSAGNFTGENGAVFSNLFGATFINTFDGNAPWGAGTAPTFVNAGLFAKTNGSVALGTTSINFQFINTGTVEVKTNTLRYGVNQQTAGLTLLNGGNLTAQDQPLQFLGGSLVGTGLVSVANVQNVINSATVNPGFPLGRLDITGNYQQTASGGLNIELGGYAPGTDFDLVTVSAGGAGGVATLGGTLNMSLPNGFSPTNGATFTFLSAVSRVGAFTTFNYPSNEIGMQISYDLTSAKVTISNLKPVVANPIVAPEPAIYGTAFNFQFPANTFTDPDNNPLSYTASGMPLGITFVSATRTFSGTPTQAGAFPVMVVANDGGTPNLAATNTFTITIDPAPLSITADAKTKTYGESDPTFTANYVGFVNNETPAVLAGTLAFTRAPGENVADYLITPSGLTSGNYAITFNTGTLSITKAALSVTAENKTKTYGESDPTFTTSYVGFVNGETPAVLAGTLVFTRAPGENVADYLITPSGLTSGNYAISFNTGNLSITKAALSITADNKTKTYGESDATFTASYVGFVNSETPAVLTGTLAFTRAPGENVADYLITPSGLTSGNYAITFNTGTLSITKAALSVTADNKTKTYGESDPTFTANYAGFVNNETPAVLAGTLVFTRAPGENVADYLITPSGLTSGNYAISFNTGNLSITKAALSITADNKTKTYGESDPTFTANYAGFVNSETPAVLTGTLAFTRAPGENVADYLITPSGLTSGNYAITFNTGTLSITKAALSITADAKTKTYGAVDPALTFTVSGLQFSDTSATVLTGALARTAGETVAGGPYSIAQGTLAPNGNYTISFTGNTLTITQSALSVTADPQTKTYGETDPVFTVTYAGFVNDETAAVLGGVLAVARAPGEDVGSFLITPSGLTSGNYAITFNTGTLSIMKAVLSITANPITKTYGAIDPALTFTVTGLKFSDTPATVLTGGLTRVAGETPAGGPYSITQGTLSPNGNYTISFSGNTLTITRAPLSVTADAKTKPYGGTDPAFTASYAGFVNGETPTVLGGTLAFARAPGENVGSYLITPSGLTSDNYIITFNTGSLSITTVALSVTADNKTKTYGSIDPAFTVSYAGFVNGETPAVLGGTLAFARAPGENVGSYLITPGGLTSDNYAITFNTGTLTITAPAPAILSLTRSGTTDVVITWAAVSNATYRVLYKSELNAANWNALPGGDVTASSVTASKMDILTTTNRFYRVQVVP